MLAHAQAFDPQHRLHYSWEYRRFFNGSHVFRLRDCTIFRIPNSTAHFRLGITLKARGTSVERNSVKRQIREFFRTHAPELGSYDYNVVVPSGRKMGFPYPTQLRHCLETRFLKELSRNVRKSPIE